MDHASLSIPREALSEFCKKQIGNDSLSTGQPDASTALFECIVYALECAEDGDSSSALELLKIIQSEIVQ
jgi:hypothetical protein